LCDIRFGLGTVRDDRIYEATHSIRPVIAVFSFGHPIGRRDQQGPGLKSDRTLFEEMKLICEYTDERGSRRQYDDRTVRLDENNRFVSRI
jgi:hypothetical protein